MAAKITIRNKANEVIIDAFNYVYSGIHMGERKVSVEIKSATPINFAIGDYIIYAENEVGQTETFTLYNLPIANRVYNSLMITYSLVFWSRAYELKTINFLDYIVGETYDNQYNRNTGQVDVQANIVMLMDRIIANMSRANASYGAWSYDIDASVDIDGTKLVSVQNVKCFDALELVNSLFGIEYRIDPSAPRLIKIGYEVGTSDEYQFGKGLGLCEITRLNSETSYVTRLYAYGSERNVPEGYRTGQFPHGYIPRIMLPNREPYLNGYIYNEDREGKHGIREDYFFDEEIFPTLPDNTVDEVLPIIDAASPDTVITRVPVKPLIVGRTTEWFNTDLNEITYVNNRGQSDDTVTQERRSTGISYAAGNGMNYDSFTLFIYTTIDINDENIKGKSDAKMSFTSGYLKGEEFQINTWTKEFDDGVPTGRYKVVLQRNVNDANYWLPNASTPVRGTVDSGEGDKFVLLNVFLPNEYVTDAEERLAVSAEKYNASRTLKPLAYSISIPEEYVALNSELRDSLRESLAFHITDTILGIDASYVIQSVAIDYKSEAQLPTYNLTIADKPIVSKFTEMETMLKNAQIKIGATNIKIEKSTANTEKSATILKSGIMNNYDEIRGSNIEAQSVLVNSMGIDLRSARYLLQAYLRVNYLDDINSVYGSSGVLIHKDIDIVWGGVFDLEHQTWTIAAPQTFTLDPAKYYWAYIKCDILTGEATWHLSETKLLANEVEGYYMFEWGQIMPVVEGERLVQQTYGSTYLMHNKVTIDPASSALASIDWEQVLTIEEQTGTDEKVKFDAADTAAGYLSEKIIPGTNITIDEGTGTDENKLKISATVDPGIKVAFDFITTAELYFVYKCPQAMVFTSQESEHTAATISPVIGTNLAQYDTVTITAVETGLIILNGNTL